jgi:hypothetical protein
MKSCRRVPKRLIAEGHPVQARDSLPCAKKTKQSTSQPLTDWQQRSESHIHWVADLRLRGV